MIRHYRFVFILLLISAGCIHVEEIKRIPKYAVYCVLNPDESKIELFLSNTYQVNQPFPIDSGKYINNAHVSIQGNNESILLLFNEKTKKYESENQGFVKENSTYFLLIIMDQDTLKAQTIVPSKPGLVIEEATVSGNEAQVTVAWEKDRLNTVAYRLLGSVETGTPSNPFFYWGSEFGIWRTDGEYTSGDFVRSPTGNFVFPQSSPKVNVLISLESLDNNWYQFKNKLDALLIRDSFTKKFESPVYYQSNVTDAVGLFGAFTKTEINFEMKK